MNIMQDMLERAGLTRAALAGQSAVVTGAGRGIGREAARALAWLGARVILAELDEATGRETAERITAEGGQALFVPTDVSSEAGVAALREQARAAFGPVDILINNAIVCPVAPVLETEAAVWDRVLAVNLRGAFLTCRAFLADMLARGRGTIVNMVSTEAMPGLAAYIASKQGLAGFTQSLAAEVGARGVRVIALAPGMVDTPAIRAVAPDLAPRLGLSLEQFLSFSPHPAYEGLMPAEHAGLATAYLAAALADEYQGEIVTGYTVLERAGLLRRPAAPPEAVRAQPAARPEIGPQAQALAEKLQAMLAETAAEFNRLPVFIRPLARNGFKGKAGQSLADWAHTAAGLAEMLGQAQTGDLARLRAESPRLKGLLERLATYYAEVPAETARFTRDAALLKQVGETSAERVAVIRDLLAALGGLAGDHG